ncbi:AAA family ATPase [Pseudactinotalea sp. HY160]|uniref:DNA repair protein RecN n=1 Tax=Pseudactinotalea sp. HY160 TaxID=2654490 RepID=UPI001312A721|nr:AAA family ATPase [Pseudactinotalea sp. HY160]
MIEDLRLRDLGVIVEAQIDLAPGLTVITGETGAGKTMLLTGLGLLLGGRADPGTVRTGAERASVEGRLVPGPGHPALTIAEDAGAELDDGALLVLRTVAAAGRSRAHLGGRSVPQAILAEVASQLVTVHGQSDQLRLRAGAQQRAALDAYAGPEHARLLAEFERAHALRAELADRLDRWDAESEERRVEVDRLEAALARIDEAAPEPGEQRLLREESERLGNVEDLRRATAIAHAALTGGEEEAGANALIEAARAAIAEAHSHDSSLAEWDRRIADIAYQLGDLAVELSAYAEGLEADPARLDYVHQRRAQLADLARDLLGRSPLVRTPDAGTPGEEDPEQEEDADAALLSFAERARTRHGDLTAPGAGREKLLADLAEAAEQENRLAAAVTAARNAAALQLEEAVAAELAELAMPGARLHVRLTPRAHLAAHGAEDVEFDLTAHRGGPRRPLAKGASGGELSRVMLALEVALASDRDEELPTFVFDEVDAGVGGRAAVAVGARLAELARHTQVIVVTHLAQVAAFADSHVVVRKHTRDGADAVTNSDILLVAGEDRTAELARMLSGDPGSATALAHAAELLERPVRAGAAAPRDGGRSGA